jgi:tetratricopeptide (TPR) repeat protein
MSRALGITAIVGSLLFTIQPCAVIGADPAPARPATVKLDGLGSHGRKISTRSPEAQEFFNQGLAFLYGFNHDEAIRSFEHAAMLDPECAMPHWGIAIANGPHINYPIVDEVHAKAAWKALTRTRVLADKATPVERELIEALGKRYADPQPEDRKPLDEAYANAMRALWLKYPVDADIGALFAEALMDLRPWDLWTRDGALQPGAQEVLHTLEAVLARAPDHPLALHLYIHAVEASPHPQMAAAAADRLRDLQPGLGHMVHMPSHIDVRLGRWQQAILVNEKAIRADTAYRNAVPEQNFYRNYMAHNHHMLAFAAMMQGQSQRSTQAIRDMLAEIPQEWLKQNAAFVDCFFAMPYELHLRFGRWDELLAEPEPPELLPIARAVRLYARGAAFAAKRQTMRARQEQTKFLAAKVSIPDEALFVLNTAQDVLGVAEQVLAGEILYREGRVDEAVDALRDAVQREDNLRYIEPPDWIQPSRHVLGATLVDAGRFAEAEAVYRRDLERHPENGWSLFGLARCLRAQQKAAEAATVESRFQAAWKHADVKLSSSCYCLPGEK